MDGSIRLTSRERKTLLDSIRKSSDPQLRLRAHIVLLLADGRSWAEIAGVLYTSSRTINRWQKRFRQGGVEALVGEPVGRPQRLTTWWLWFVLYWVSDCAPREFGLVKSRWTCEAVAVVLVEEHHVHVSAETIRRQLHAAGFAWRRPRPVLGPRDPDYERKLREIQRLLATLPDDETVVFADEVDVHLNPKIGSMWMRTGEQAEVVTPGNNVKRHLAGSLHWRSGRLILSDPATRRNQDLFVAHLKQLVRSLRRFRVIRVVCDNAAFHKSRKVQEFLAQANGRIVVHFLPAYAPETNPIERVWWHLHENVTRNHRCASIEELLEQVFEWADRHRTFQIETSLYSQPKRLAA